MPSFLHHTYHRLVPWLTLFGICVLTYLIYRAGITGAMYYDDAPALYGLQFVSDLGSALNFIFSEISGPLGRPVTMASFLLNVDDWPERTENILHLNILLHVANGLLVAAIAWSLAQLRFAQPGASGRSGWVAAAAAALWLLLPIHISTSLIAIQRMAGLSGFFVFAGIALYLRGIVMAGEQPRVGALLQLTGTVFFTLLAMFAKENGAVLPILALTIEATVLANVGRAERWRKLRISSFAACLVFLVGYLAYTTRSAEIAYAVRDFSLVERLVTQPAVLLEYIKNAFMPRLFAFHPFHDAYAPARSLTSDPYAILPVLLWPTLVTSALVYRHKFPLAAFAVLWFVAGHLIESTVLALELYFEHRNYIPLVGPCLAIALSLNNVPKGLLRPAILGFSAYLLILAASLLQVTSLWGDKETAAVAWMAHANGSPRAAEHLAQRYIERNELEEAWDTLERQTNKCPDCIDSHALALLLSCQMNEPARTQFHQEKISQLTETKHNVGTAPYQLTLAHQAIRDGRCTSLTVEQLTRLNTQMLRFQTGGKKQLLHYNLYQLELDRGDEREALRQLEHSWTSGPDMEIADQYVNRMLESGFYDKATTFIKDQMCARLPSNPFVANPIRRRCDEAMHRALEAKRNSEPAAKP